MDQLDPKPAAPLGGMPENIEIIVIEIVELEEHAKHHGTHAPHARHYAFRVDKERIVVDKPKISGTEILAKVGKTPDKYKLYQHKRGHQPILIGPSQIVDLREPCVERFTTMPKDTTEGVAAICTRRDFRLPQLDEDYLDGLGLPWETVIEANVRWVLIHEWKLPAGYNHHSTSLALLIPSNYSDSQIDMVYFKQHLARTDTKPINALSTQPLAGTIWQRWSRHRTNQSPWRAGVDDIASHLSLVADWLSREFAKAA